MIISLITVSIYNLTGAASYYNFLDALNLAALSSEYLPLITHHLLPYNLFSIV